MACSRFNLTTFAYLKTLFGILGKPAELNITLKGLNRNQWVHFAQHNE